MAHPAPAELFHPRAFKGRVFGVTGGGHGIGEATIRRLLGLGARVAVLDNDADHLKRVKGELAEHDGRAAFFRGDVADRDFLTRSIRSTHRRWGRIHGWVSNAAYNSFSRLEEDTPQMFERAWRVNVEAAWLACRLLAPGMRDAGGGAFVHLSTMLARDAARGNAAYIASKAGVEGLTRALAVELASDRIRVNAVVPGMIDTGRRGGAWLARLRRRFGGVPEDAIQQYRALRQRFRELQWQHLQPWPSHGQADEVASVILFLLSDAASFITGESILVDGGATVYHAALRDLPVAEMAARRAELDALIERYPPLGIPLWRRREADAGASRKSPNGSGPSPLPSPSEARGGAATASKGAAAPPNATRRTPK